MKLKWPHIIRNPKSVDEKSEKSFVSRSLSMMHFYTYVYMSFLSYFQIWNNFSRNCSIIPNNSVLKIYLINSTLVFDPYIGLTISLLRISEKVECSRHIVFGTTVLIQGCTNLNLRCCTLFPISRLSKILYLDEHLINLKIKKKKKNRFYRNTTCFNNKFIY